MDNLMRVPMVAVIRELERNPARFDSKKALV